MKVLTTEEKTKLYNDGDGLEYPFKFIKADSSYLSKSPYDTKKPTILTQGEYKKMFEDAMLAEVDTWDEVKVAYIYKILHARNYRIDSVTAIVRRAVFDTVDCGIVRGKVV